MKKGYKLKKEIISSLLEQNKLNTNEVAQIIGLSYSHLSGCITGERKLSKENIKKLASFLNVTPNKIAIFPKKRNSNNISLLKNSDLNKRDHLHDKINNEIAIEFFKNMSTEAQVKLMENLLKK